MDQTDLVNVMTQWSRRELLQDVLMRPDDSHEAPDQVTLREITRSNRAQLEALRVADNQQNLVDGVKDSLAEAAATIGSRPWCRAICMGQTPVGFLMLADDVPPDDPVIPWRYYLWRMLIDGRYQGRGYGSAALDLVTEYLRGRPGADALVTSVVPGEGSALGFYRNYGFEATGEWLDHEQVLRLPLGASVRQ